MKSCVVNLIILNEVIDSILSNRKRAHQWEAECNQGELHPAQEIQQGEAGNSTGDHHDDFKEDDDEDQYNDFEHDDDDDDDEYLGDND